MAKKPAKPPVAESDARLFDAAMKDVAPLAPRPPAPAKPAPPEKPPAPSRKTVALPPPPAVAPRAPAPLAAGAAVDLDARTMLRLRRGRLRPEARLDLHGMTQEAAYRALAGFLARARADGKRCVLVVTGTGRWREGAGILRDQTPKWLNAPALRPAVLGFAAAQPGDGGDGALYVLLRRKRPRGDGQ